MDIKKIIISLCILLSVLSQINVVHADDNNSNASLVKEDKNVLYISSYSPALFTFDQQREGIIEIFEGEPIHVDSTFMDTKDFNTPENIEQFFTNLKYKLDNGKSYDAVIVGDDNGLAYLMEERETLFPDTPIFFMGINSLTLANNSAEHPMVTGVLEAKSIFNTIEMANNLNKKADRVVIIRDNTRSSESEFNEILTYQKDFPNLEFVDLNMSEYSFHEFYAEVEYLDKRDIVMYVSGVKDKNGQVSTYDELRHKFDELLDTPMYGLTDYGVGDGMFGGCVITHVEQGRAAARQVMAYFTGSNMEDIEVLAESPNLYMVDYEQMKEFGYNMNELPENTYMINVSVFEKYRPFILVGIVVILIQTLMIVMLFKNINGRRKSEKSLQESKENIQQMNEELIATVDELHESNRELEDSIIEVNDRDRQIKEMIYLDKLTGLETRYALNEELDQLISQGHPFALYMLNIDNFKNINEAFGHIAGDRVLYKIGQRLEAITTNDIRVFRFGGDEFVIIAIDGNQVKAVKSMIDHLNSILSEMVIIDDNCFVMSASYGVAMYPDHGDSQELMLKYVDIALNESKSSGKDNYRIYNKKLKAKLYNTIQFQNMIRDAFIHNEFYLNYQPIVDINSGQVHAFEALIRWTSESFGQVSPYKLITEAEDMGMIIKLGEWIFREACLFAKNILAEKAHVAYMSINISAVQLVYNGFVDSLKNIVIEVGIEPHKICLEMTETTLIQDLDLGRKIIDELNDFGFLIALDDFGTGYSSLNYLKNLKIDILKIDKVFIDTIVESKYDRYLVEAVMKIAEARDIKTVGEGVENKDQYLVLKDMKCDAIQGYYFSKPLMANQVINYKVKGL